MKSLLVLLALAATAFADDKKPAPALTPGKAVVLVLDRSGSMTGLKMEMTKAAAIAAIHALAPDDLVAVVVFDSVPSVVEPLQRAASAREADILKIDPHGGTNIQPALHAAYQLLQPVKATHKHVLVLTDGQAPYDGIEETLDEMQANNITTSAIGLGGDTDKQLIQLIAEHGMGKAYFVDDAKDLPKVFTKDVTD
jgi:Ca-activated chloride channel family protein